MLATVKLCSLDDVDLLDGVLAHVAAVKLVGLPVEATAERVAESPRAYFAPLACAGKRRIMDGC